MPRTTSNSVKNILGANYDGTTPLHPFVITASSLVNKVAGKDLTGVLSSDDLELIERWLAAHFYGHADQFYQQRSTGRASGGFQGQTAMVFNSTQYGQTALALDVTGELARIQQQATTGKQKAGILWGGTRMTNDNSERSEDQLS